MISWVFAAGAAGFAFFLSSVVGLLSRVGLGSLFIRALGSGLVFALLAAGGELLLRSFFPELLPAQGSSDQSEEAVDEDSETPGGGAVDITVDDGEEDDVAFEAEGESPGEDFVEEVEHPRPEPQLAVGSEEGDDEVESLESVDSMEELPSLDGFSDSFESSYGEGHGEDSNLAGGSKDVDVDIMGEAQSAGEVAQAVKTMLKRDQEG